MTVAPEYVQKYDPHNPKLHLGRHPSSVQNQVCQGLLDSAPPPSLRTHTLEIQSGSVMLSVRQDDWMWVDATRPMHHGGPRLWDGRIAAEGLFRKLPLAHHEGVCVR